MSRHNDVCPSAHSATTSDNLEPQSTRANAGEKRPVESSLDAVGRAGGFWGGAESRCRHEVRRGAEVRHVEVRRGAEVRRAEVRRGAEVRHVEVRSSAGVRCCNVRGGAEMRRHDRGWSRAALPPGGAGSPQCARLVGSRGCREPPRRCRCSAEAAGQREPAAALPPYVPTAPRGAPLASTQHTDTPLPTMWPMLAPCICASEGRS